MLHGLMHRIIGIGGPDVNYDTWLQGGESSGIGSGKKGNVNNIHILGGTVRSFGYHSIGCGVDGGNGNIVLGDNIQIENVEYDKRYQALTNSKALILKG